MPPPSPPRSTSRRVRVVVLLTLSVTALLLACFWNSLFAARPLVLRFLYYTNNAARDRIVVLEISNRTGVAYEWRLHSNRRPANELVPVTELVEPNGELWPVSPYNGDNLFGHDARSFATTEFKVGERFWAEARPYPKTAGERRREKLAGWFWRHGMRRIAWFVQEGQRIHGPALPPDGPEP